MKLTDYLFFICASLHAISGKAITSQNKNIYLSGNAIKEGIEKLIKDNESIKNEVDLKITIFNTSNFNPDKAIAESYQSKLYYVDVKKNQKKSTDFKLKVAILGGEHARELITVDFLFEYVKSLVTSKILDMYDFRIIVNANPISREEIFNKDNYCKRGNPNKVDLNRNWDYFFNKDITTDEEYPGTKALSEIETLFILDAFKEYKPDIFLSVHSGEYSLFHPYAYPQPNFREQDFQDILQVFQKVIASLCSTCRAGHPTKILNYKSSGSSLDYFYEVLKVPVSIAVEIYTNERSFSDIGINVSPSQSGSLRANRKSRLSSEIKSNSKEQNDDCFSLFNPLSKEHLTLVSDRWTKIFDEMFTQLQGVVKRKKKLK